MPVRRPYYAATTDCAWKTVEKVMDDLSTHPLNRAADGAPQVGRAFHRDSIGNAIGKIVMSGNAALPPSVQKSLEAMLGPPGSELTTALRFSKGLGCPFKDAMPDVVGLGCKVKNAAGEEVDLPARTSRTARTPARPRSSGSSPR